MRQLTTAARILLLRTYVYGCETTEIDEIRHPFGGETVYDIVISRTARYHSSVIGLRFSGVDRSNFIGVVREFECFTREIAGTLPRRRLEEGL